MIELKDSTKVYTKNGIIIISIIIIIAIISIIYLFTVEKISTWL